jgi:hypothetical protein
MSPSLWPYPLVQPSISLISKHRCVSVFRFVLGSVFIFDYLAAKGSPFSQGRDSDSLKAGDLATEVINSTRSLLKDKGSSICVSCKRDTPHHAPHHTPSAIPIA